MTAVILLLVIVLVALLVNRIATTALMATGMSRQYARFQARSAFTGVGFTTSEAEDVVSHPVRRRIVMVLMLLGNAGLATVVATLLFGFTGTDASQWLRRSAVLVIGLGAIWMLAANQRAERALRNLFTRLLRGDGPVPVHDYVGLLHVGGDYSIGELQVQDGDWIADRTLADLRLRDEGVAVLGVEHAGEYRGAPGGSTRVAAGDTLVIYGRTEALESLDARRRGTGGELSHIDQVFAHRQRAQAESETGEPSAPSRRDQDRRDTHAPANDQGGRSDHAGPPKQGQ